MHGRDLKNSSPLPLHCHKGMMDVLYGHRQRFSSAHGVRKLTGQIMNALRYLKKFVKDKVLGDPVQDWGVVYLQQGRFATEQLKLALYKKNEKLNLVLNITYKTLLGPNTWLIVFSDVTLPEYVEKLESNYTVFCNMMYQSRKYSATSEDKLPFSTRLLLKLLFGFRVSKLLLDTTLYKDIFKIYGFITRSQKRKVLIAPNYISSDSGNIISGEGFKAIIDTLSTYIKEKGYKKAINRKPDYRFYCTVRPRCESSTAPV